MTKPIKIIIAGIFGLLITVLIVVYVYRYYFKFNNKLVNQMAQAAANDTGNPDRAYQLITEGVSFIKNSRSLTKQVEISAQVDNIDPEQELVNTALKNCYASGHLEAPSNE